MRNLLNFILKYNYWFLFIFLEVISIALLFRYNRFQGSVFFTSANVVCGKVYGVSSGVTSYFHLKTINDDLIDRNIHLEQELAALRHKLFLSTDTVMKLDSVSASLLNDFQFMRAEVINKTVSKYDNYITIDKGEADGIRHDMGVVNGCGVVGTVFLTGRNYSIVLPVLNSNSKISCKVKNRDYSGFLRWNGGDPMFANLEEIPRHARFHKGDTIVTSGYSEMFPPGLMVGQIDKISNSADGMSYQLRVRLTTNFSTLNSVRVITNKHSEELQQLQKQLDEHTEILNK